MLKWALRGLLFGINPIAYGATLHKDNRMMPVLARRGRRKTEDILSTKCTGDGLKTDGG